MGTISSVYVGPALRSNFESNTPNRDESSVDDASETNPENVQDSERIEEGIQEGRGSIMEVHLNHSCSSVDDRLRHSQRRDDELGITIQYLAQENVKLARANKQLLNELQQAKKKLEESSIARENKDEIFGESLESKLERLEKTLAIERQEKWASIEASEVTRVSLVNCQRELLERDKAIKNLEKELDNSQKLIKDFEETVERLKKSTNSDEAAGSAGEKHKSACELEKFRQDLNSKREIRQKALSAVSCELHKLREELENEKAVRRKLERDIQIRDSAEGDEPPADVPIVAIQKENRILKEEISLLTEDTQKLKDFRTENNLLKLEIKKLCQEIRRLNTLILQLKNDYKEEKRKHERTLREKTEIEEEKERNVKMRIDLEHEKEKTWEEYDREKEEINKRTTALKEVVQISKQMLAIRESQVEELKNKLRDIEESMKQSKMLEENGLKAEYEKQLQNIKTLKELYEERVSLLELEKVKLNEAISDHTKTVEDLKTEMEDLKGKFENASEELEKEKQENQNLERDLKLSVAKSKDFENELTVMNNMFTQMLLGPYNSGNDADLDKLTELLQENHDLITEMTAREDSSEIASALPKLLLDLITQVEGNDGSTQFDFQQNCTRRDDKKMDPLLESTDTISEQSESILEENQGAVLPILSYKNATVFKNPISVEEAHFKKEEEVKTQEETNRTLENVSPTVQEIASNLPKVWKVLMELLSHHSVPEELHTPGDEKQCYKYVETPNGMRSVISVSKTFIRLKDLILEKKSLTKELSRLKHLNSHLECRLDDQEKRLSQVQCELHKTWGIVGRMRAEHQQLHNHEKILRYELQEKRVMLSELKEELEYCRDKWEKARQKNNESETEWKKLRREFAARKVKGYNRLDFHDSGESGFSDEQTESGEEPDNFDADRSNTQSPVTKLTTVPVLLPDKAAETGAGVGDGEGEVEPVDGTDASDELTTCESSETSSSSSRSEADECAVASASAGAVPRTTRDAEVKNMGRDRSGEARAARLQRLEDQCQLLVRKVDITTHKSNFLSNRLDELHQQYGSNQAENNVNCGVAEEAAEDQTQVPESTSSSCIDICRAQINQVEDAAICVSEIENIQGMTHALLKTDEKPQSKHETVLQSDVKPEKGFDEIMNARAERLKRLEEQCKSLVGKVTNTVKKSNDLSNKLGEIHEEYVQYEGSKTSRSDTSSIGVTSKAGGPGEAGLSSSRLQSLEKECRALSEQIKNTVQKSEDVSRKLEKLHIAHVHDEQSRTKGGTDVSRDIATEEEENKREIQTERKRRLQRFEEECRVLKGQVTRTAERSNDLLNQLEEMHRKCVRYEELTPNQNDAPSAYANASAKPDDISAMDALFERLQRLEEECTALKEKVLSINQRSDILSNRIDGLHNEYTFCDESKTQEEAATLISSCKHSPEEQINRLQKVENEFRTLEEPISGKAQGINDLLENGGTTDANAAELQGLKEHCQSLVAEDTKTIEKTSDCAVKLDQTHEGNVSYETLELNLNFEQPETEEIELEEAQKREKTESSTTNDRNDEERK